MMVEETKSISNMGESDMNSSHKALNKVLGASGNNFSSQQHSSTAISQGNLTHQTDNSGKNKLSGGANGYSSRILTTSKATDKDIAMAMNTL